MAVAENATINVVGSSNRADPNGVVQNDAVGGDRHHHLPLHHQSTKTPPSAADQTFINLMVQQQQQQQMITAQQSAPNGQPATANQKLPPNSGIQQHHSVNGNELPDRHHSSNNNSSHHHHQNINGVDMRRNGGVHDDHDGGSDDAGEGFKREMRDLEEMLSKLNPMAEEFVPPSLAAINHHLRLLPPAAGAGHFGFNANGFVIHPNTGIPNGNSARRKKNYSHGKRRMNTRTSMAQQEDVIRRTVYVSDIDHQVTEEQLAALFLGCGQVVDCRVCGDPNSVLRFAFIEFTDEEGARNALSLAGTMLGYYPVRVLPSKTAIAPVNPTFLPRSEDEREMCARTIYCTNIDKKVTQADVKLFFESICGEVHRLRLLGDYHHSTRIAFVEFVMAESAIAALNCSGAVLGSLPIRVSPSKTPVRPRAPRPPKKHTLTHTHTLTLKKVAMEISIVDHELPHESHNFYDVYFFNDRINTLVTHDPSMVSNWLYHTQRIHHHRLSNLIVGLDIEWRPSFNKYQQNPVATLQICVGRRCLVFQILHCSYDYEIPDDLRDFLSNEDFTFVGVGIGSDVEKLEEDYGLQVGGRIVDLSKLAADLYGEKRLKSAGIKGLARLVLGREVEKPRRVTMGRWDNRWLTPDQVQYACVDAFVSFEIGRSLNANQGE